MYDVVFLNANLETEYRAKTIDYYWHSKWYEPGEFQIEIIDDTDFNFDACKYVVTNTKKEIGIVGRWQRKSDDPQVVLISGLFMEQELFHHVVYPTYSGKRSVWDHADRLCDRYLDNIGLNLSVLGKPSNGVISPDSASVDFQQTGEYVGTALYALASVYGYGVSVTRAENGLDVGIVNYHDRTGETDDEEIVLSVSFNNVKNYDVVHDETAYRNVAIVAGEGEGSARVVQEVDISKDGEKKSYLWVDARDLAQEEDETVADYREKLRQRGLEKLAENVVIDNVEVEISDEDAERIGIDFDIGDIIGVAINPLKLYYRMKIIEVEDIYNQGKRAVALVFGSKIPTPWEKVRTLYR